MARDLADSAAGGALTSYHLATPVSGLAVDAKEVVTAGVFVELSELLGLISNEKQRESSYQVDAAGTRILG